MQRFECKYVLTEQQAASARSCCAPWVRPDPFAEDAPDQRYRVSTLYFDTPSLQLFRETVEGNRDRFKLRIRTYSDDADAPFWVEIKKRRNLVIRKVRVPVPRRELARLVGTGSIDCAHMSPNEIATIEEFRTKLHARGARPLVQVGYEREAWIGREDPTARVTFDRRILSRATRAAELRMARPDWDLVEGRLVVLELKFNGRCPRWMEHAIHRLGLFRRSYSKYTHAVRASMQSLRTRTGS